MEIPAFLIANLAGTIAMTLFTYALSAILGKRYEQPILIDYLQAALGIEFSHLQRMVNGWILHCLTGAIFLLLLHLYWHFDPARITWNSLFFLGPAAGILGMVIWKVSFTLPRYKIIPDRGFYLFIFLAHIVFVAGAIAGYQCPSY